MRRLACRVALLASGLATGVATGLATGLAACDAAKIPALPLAAASERVAIADLPARADGALRMSEPGVSIAVRFPDARPAPRSDDGGAARYARAFEGGTDLIRTRRPAGLEDDLLFVRRPTVERARMVVTLERAGGLRLVGRILEVLDAAGAPRIRMAAPVMFDAKGGRNDVAVDVIGCAVDRDPRAPWGRPTTRPGSDACVVELGWTLGAEAYPARLDPYWTTTAVMTEPRAGHSATLLDDGTVLVAGGTSADADRATAELFDPVSDTFATTGSLDVARRAHQAIRLPDGRVLVVGGESGLGATTGLASVERYDPGSGLWTSLPDLPEPRSQSKVIALPDGGLLLPGGYDWVVDDARRTVIRCNGSGTGCDFVAPMTSRRAAYAAASTDDGRVVVTGGGRAIFSDETSFLATSEIYDPDADAWSPGPDLPRRRIDHVAVGLPDGRTVFVGGTAQPQGALMLDDVDVLDAAATSITPLGELAVPRWLHRAALLPRGDVLVAGRGALGFGPTVERTTEIVDTSAGVAASTGDLDVARFLFTMTALDDGRVLVTGGKNTPGPNEIDEVEIFGARLGSACDPLDASSCPNGLCVDGVCSAASTAAGGGGGGGGGGGTSSAGAGGDGSTTAVGSTTTTSAAAGGGDGGGAFATGSAVSSASDASSASSTEAVGGTASAGGAPTSSRDEGAAQSSFYGCSTGAGTRSGLDGAALLALGAAGIALRGRPRRVAARER